LLPGKPLCSISKSSSNIYTIRYFAIESYAKIRILDHFPWETQEFPYTGGIRRVSGEGVDCYALPG